MEANKEKNGIERLKEYAKKEIEYCNDEISRKKDEINEYNGIKNRLDLLPKKLTHDILVPLGKVGYMPGKLINTNKVTVLLGDNYFVERSSFQACEIIDRRIKIIEEFIEKFQSQRKNAYSQLEYGEQLFSTGTDQVEIREEYDEQKELLWKSNRVNNRKGKIERIEADHRDMVLFDSETNTLDGNNDTENVDVGILSDEIVNDEILKESIVQSEDIGAQDSSVKSKQDAWLMRRLDELEKQEEDGNEINSDSESSLDSDDFSSSESAMRQLDTVKSVNSIKSTAIENLKNIFYDEQREVMKKEKKLIEEIEVVPKKKLSVRFRTDIEVRSPVFNNSEDDQMTKFTDAEVSKSKEPKNLIKDEPRFSSSLPRSILRNSNERSPIDVNAIAASQYYDTPRILPSSQTAFIGDIQERFSPDSVQQSSIDSNAEKLININAEPKRISRFKMTRANLY